MNKKAGVFVVFLLIFLPSVYGVTAVTEINDGIELNGNDSSTIEGGSHIVYGGFFLGDNASLTLKNTVITFADVEDAEYMITGNSRLTVINSSIIWLGPRSLRALQNASIELINVEIYSTYEVNNRTYYHTGIGQSDTSRIRARDSTIGFIRLAEKAQCNFNNSNIGNFGTRSTVEAEFNNCTVESLTLYFERSRVQINQTLTGKHDVFTQSQLVKVGENPLDFKMNNCNLLTPPRIIIVDGKLEAKDTALDTVYVDGDSAIETTNTSIYELAIMGYCWAIIEDSKIDYINAWRGDFNIQLTNTTHKRIYTMDTVGLNLQTNGSKIDQLVLEEAVEYTPQNVELHNTEIGDLFIMMQSPQPIQCDQVTIGNLTTGLGRGNEQPITITGTVHFKPDAEVNQQTKEGYTCIRRIYLIEATVDNQPAADTEITISLENHTKIITTNQEGRAVLPVTYLYHFGLVSNPPSGGPYLYNHDNLTKPVTITLNNQNFTLGILSDALVRLAATSSTASDRWEPDWKQYTPAAVILTIIAILIYLYNSRRLERENRQIQ